MDEIPSTDRPPSHADVRRRRSEYRWRVEAHDRSTRFHLGFNLALAAAALALLKIEGPYFSDAIAAGLFICGFFACVFSIRSLRASRAAVLAATPEGEPPRHRSATMFFICLAVFHLASAVATIWLTYLVPPEVQTYPDAVAVSHARQPSHIDEQLTS